MTGYRARNICDGTNDIRCRYQKGWGSCEGKDGVSTEYGDPQPAAAFASTVRPRASETWVGKITVVEDRHDLFIVMAGKISNAEDTQYVVIVMACPRT